MANIFYVAREQEQFVFYKHEPEYTVFSKEPKFKKDGTMAQRSIDNYEDCFCADFWERITGIVIPPGKCVRVKMTVMKGLKS